TWRTSVLRPTRAPRAGNFSALRQRRSALEEAPFALAADEIAVFHHVLAAGEDHCRCADYLAALVRAVVGLRVVRFGRDGVPLLRVPDDHVCVSPGREGAFLALQAEE